MEESEKAGSRWELNSGLSHPCSATQWRFYWGGGGWSPPKLALPHPLVLCLDDTKFHIMSSYLELGHARAMWKARWEAEEYI